MAGRHVGPTFTKIEGDKDIAARYWGVATKLLGMLKEHMARNNLTQLVWRKPGPEGIQFVVAHIRGQDFIAVEAPQPLEVTPPTSSSRGFLFSGTGYNGLITAKDAGAWAKYWPGNSYGGRFPDPPLPSVSSRAYYTGQSDNVVSWDNSSFYTYGYKISDAPPDTTSVLGAWITPGDVLYVCINSNSSELTTPGVTIVKKPWTFGVTSSPNWYHPTTQPDGWQIVHETGIFSSPPLRTVSQTTGQLGTNAADFGGDYTIFNLNDGGAAYTTGTYDYGSILYFNGTGSFNYSGSNVLGPPGVVSYDCSTSFSSSAQPASTDVGSWLCYVDNTLEINQARWTYSILQTTSSDVTHTSTGPPDSVDCTYNNFSEVDYSRYAKYSTLTEVKTGRNKEISTTLQTCTETQENPNPPYNTSYVWEGGTTVSTIHYVCEITEIKRGSHVYPFLFLTRFDNEYTDATVSGNGFLYTGNIIVELLDVRSNQVLYSETVAVTDMYYAVEGVNVIPEYEVNCPAPNWDSYAQRPNYDDSRLPQLPGDVSDGGTCTYAYRASGFYGDFRMSFKISVESVAELPDGALCIILNDREASGGFPGQKRGMLVSPTGDVETVMNVTMDDYASYRVLPI